MKGYGERIKQQDYMNWLSNQYTLSAVMVAIDKALNGKKSKAEYVKEPALSKFIDESELTEEEREKREMEREILAMERWISNDKARGLPETKIK